MQICSSGRAECEPVTTTGRALGPDAGGGVRDVYAGRADAPGIAVPVIGVLVDENEAVAGVDGREVTDLRSDACLAINTGFGEKAPMHPVEDAFLSEVDDGALRDGIEADVEGEFKVWLSDTSAPAYTSGINSSVMNQLNGPSGVYTINYAANSTG